MLLFGASDTKGKRKKRDWSDILSWMFGFGTGVFWGMPARVFSRERDESNAAVIERSRGHGDET